MSGWGDDDRTREIYERISEKERWRNRKEQIKNQSLGRQEGYDNVVKKKVEDAIEARRNHDDLLTSTISAFGPTSHIYNETGWRLICAEPLHEKDPSLSNPDTIIGNPNRDTAIVVECKTGLASPVNALDQVQSAAETVLDYRDYLSENGGISFTDVERVLCVPGRISETAKDAIERTAESRSSNPILLWKLHRFQKETLQLHTDFRNRDKDESTHNSRLSEILSGTGIEIAEDPLLSSRVRIYPESHPLVIIEECFSEMLFTRAQDDRSIRKFTRVELYDLMDNQKHMPHYATDIIAEDLCDKIVDILLDFNLIEAVDPSSEGLANDVRLYKYNDNIVRGKTSGTILSNLCAGYKEKLIERKAETRAIEQTVDEFRDGQTSLADF